MGVLITNLPAVRMFLTAAGLAPVLDRFASSRQTRRRDTSCAIVEQPAPRARCLVRKLPRRRKACLRSSPLGGSKAQLPQRHTCDAGIGLAVFDIVALFVHPQVHAELRRGRRQNQRSPHDGQDAFRRDLNHQSPEDQGE